MRCSVAPAPRPADADGPGRTLSASRTALAGAGASEASILAMPGVGALTASVPRGPPPRLLAHGAWVVALVSADARGAVGPRPLGVGRAFAAPGAGSVRLVRPDDAVGPWPVVAAADAPAACAPTVFALLALSPRRLHALAHACGSGAHARAVARTALGWHEDPPTAELLAAVGRCVAGDGPAARLALEGLARRCVARLVEPVRAPAGGPDRGSDAGRRLSPAALARIEAFVDARLDTGIAVAELAGLAGLGRDRFARAFANATGMTPYRYVLERRLARARDLLVASDAPLVEIAGAAGFASQSHMTDVFRHRLGTTPGRYRRSRTGCAASARGRPHGTTTTAA